MRNGEKQPWLIKPQPRMGALGIIALLVVANILVPFSTDIYTPALPSLPEYFGTDESVVNLTLILFFLFLTFGSLVFGPVSDRFGRKPVLVAGLLLYTISSFLCAVAWRIGLLITFRILEAIGAGAVTSVSMALVKDCFTEQRREQLLALIQVLMVIGPIAAPLFGGLILAVADWRAVFVVLGILGMFCTILSFLFTETLPIAERTSPGFGRTLSGLVKVGRNPAFMTLLLVVALVNAGFSAYLVAAPYIYIDFFGCTAQVYTYYFAATAAIATLGPIGWVAISSHTTPRKFTHVMLALCLAGGIGVLLIGPGSPTLFCAFFATYSLCSAAIRPYTTNILLAQQSRDTGSASSLINFTCSIFGVLGMGLAVLPWPTYVFGLGALLSGFSVLAIITWVVLLRSERTHIKELDR